MTKERVKEYLEFAIVALSKHQPNLFIFSDETNQSEWNIAHHYANEISAIFRNYDCDVELIKPNLDSRRPDITIHERGKNERNFLVIELKRSLDDVHDDEIKIRDWWFSDSLHYQYGAMVVINDFGNSSVKVFSNET
jgi:hypothetical protein